MKTGIRIVLCGALAAIALTMAVFTLAGFSTSRRTASQPSEMYYVLGERDGNVAVYSSGNLDQPVTVTNIELSQLREADRSMISARLIAGSETQLLQLLEDLGS